MWAHSLISATISLISFEIDRWNAILPEQLAGAPWENSKLTYKYLPPQQLIYQNSRPLCWDCLRLGDLSDELHQSSSWVYSLPSSPTSLDFFRITSRSQCPWSYRPWCLVAKIQDELGKSPCVPETRWQRWAGEWNCGNPSGTRIAYWERSGRQACLWLFCCQWCYMGPLIR
jgi:hypothetical protein